jgi:hypothetical protein
MVRSGLRRALLKRWYLVLAGLAATMVLCFGAMKAVPVSYEASADSLLVPAVATTGGGQNPYLAVGGLTAPADVLAKAMGDVSILTSLRKAGISGSYAVSRDMSTNGPMVLVTAKDKTAAGALATLNAVVARLGPTMQRLQDSLSPPVPARYQLTVHPVLSAKSASPLRKSQIRALFVAAAAGLIGTVFGVALFEGFVIRRQARHGVRMADAELATEAGSALTLNGNGNGRTGPPHYTDVPMPRERTLVRRGRNATRAARRHG